MFQYTIQPDSDIPIYRQLVDQINAQIRSGALRTGTQLPTVREMAERLNLSCGTVKRVYDRLQEMGDIEMTRRRGTFVKYVREDTDSRKIQAMAAIDRMIRQLSDLNFSPSEIHIFVNLKMREWGLKWSGIHIALVTEYMEIAGRLRRQLSQMGNVTVDIWQMNQVRDYPYNINEQSDVILASPEDARKLTAMLPDQAKCIQIAFAVQPRCLLEIARLPGRPLGLICREAAFAQLVQGYLTEEARVYCSGDVDWLAFLRDVEAVVAPQSYEDFCDAEFSQALAALEADGRLVRFDYGIDEGSMIYLEERINRIRDARQLRPGAMSFWRDDAGGEQK